MHEVVFGHYQNVDMLTEITKQIAIYNFVTFSLRFVRNMISTRDNTQ